MMAEVVVIRPMNREEFAIMKNVVSTVQIVDSMFAKEGADAGYSRSRMNKVAEKIAVSATKRQVENLLTFVGIVRDCAQNECIDIEASDIVDIKSESFEPN